MFCFLCAARYCPKIPSKRPKIDFQKHLIILASSFLAPDPQKRENTSRVKDFGGGSARPGLVKLAACYHLIRQHRRIISAAAAPASPTPGTTWLNECREGPTGPLSEHG